MFKAGWREYRSAIATGVGVSLVAGLLAGLARSIIPFFGLIITVAVGYLIGSAIYESANRRSTTGLRVLAALCVLLAFGIMGVAVPLMANPGLLFTAPAAVIGSVLLSILGLLTSPFGLLAAGLAIFLAVTRI